MELRIVEWRLGGLWEGFGGLRGLLKFVKGGKVFFWYLLIFIEIGWGMDCLVLVRLVMF